RASTCEIERPPNSDQAASIDVRTQFKLYLVWQYPSGVVYTIAYNNWYTNFFADTNVAGQGVTNIKVTNGVTADNFARSNTDPPQQGLTSPIYNSAINTQ